MTDPTRRHLLRAGALALATSIAGCAGSDDGAEAQSDGEQSATDDSPTSSPTADCTPDVRPEPTPTAEGLQPRSYPTYPESITESSAREFAEDFESAYQVNRFLAETFIEGTDEIQVETSFVDGTVRENGERVFVGVDGTLRTADVETPTNSTGTQAPYLDARFDAWYELTATRARRTTVTDLTRDQSVPDFEYADVVACAE